MIKLAPNVYVLEYLMTTKQLSDANEKIAYGFIQSGILVLRLPSTIKFLVFVLFRFYLNSFKRDKNEEKKGNI